MRLLSGAEHKLKPLAIDLFCGLGGWAEGFLSEGFDVIGFDVERHDYGTGGYPGQLVIQDVLTLHGSQFKDAAVIVASPPCQNYSYLAMPWSRSKSDHSRKAKAMRKKWETEGPDNALFDACFRIQREACEAADRFIPMVIENVRGAEPWVGRAAWRYGSFFLWGDIPALMPIGGRRKGLKVQATRGVEVPVGVWKTLWFHGNTKHQHRADPRDIRRDENGDWVRLDGTKIGGDWFSDPKSTCRRHSSRSTARKFASAQIAKIPFPLASWIARCYKPDTQERVA